MNFKGKRVLITGGAGFLGSALGSALQKLGASVDVLDIKDPERWDVATLGCVDQFMCRRPDIVFHLAAQTEVRKADDNPHLTYRTNVHGTLNVLEACREYRPEAIVIASTDKVYGDQEGPVTESSRFLTNADIYSASKRLADDMAQDYARVYKLPLRVLRCANTYGPGQKNTTTLITNSLNKLMKKELPVLYADSQETVREWLYIDDAVQAYILMASDAAERKLTWHGAGTFAYNIGTGQRFTNREVVKALIRGWDFGKGFLATQDEPSPFLVQNVNQRPQIACQPVLSCMKFRAAFPHWSPLVFSSGIQRTIAWHKNEGAIL